MSEGLLFTVMKKNKDALIGHGRLLSIFWWYMIWFMNDLAVRLHPVTLLIFETWF